MAVRDTIFALATARGQAGVSIIRLSGPNAVAAVETLAGPLPPWRELRFRVLRDPGTGHVLDEGLVVRFRREHSYTGEETVEIQGHGSFAAQELLLNYLGLQVGLRLAEPGEFTRLALENGRLDMAQVEGLADLIEAETAAQHDQAMKVMRGGLSRLTEEWREHLVKAAAVLAAVIDFSDEELPDGLVKQVGAHFDFVRHGIAEQLSQFATGERVRRGFEVAIVGAPNAGKSTLLNRIAGREAAIVSDIPGTTRDVIEVRVDLGGVPVTILDTAGLRGTTDVVEQKGVDRALSRARDADLRVYLLDGDGMAPEWRLWEKPGDILVCGKVDVVEERSSGVSGLTGAGVDALLGEVQQTLAERVPVDLVVIRKRQADGLRSADRALISAQDFLSDEHIDLCAEEVRLAMRSLDSLVGKVDVEDLLDEVFSRFCLGK